MKTNPPFLPALILGALLCLHSAHTVDAAPDHEISLAVVEHQMAFDKTEFTVAAGSTVRIHFNNTDGMIHNLIFAAESGGEDVYMTIARQVMDLGANAHARQFVPDSDLVLAASKLLQPGESDTFTFTAPEEVGPYPYVCAIPGHPRSMNGIMHVTADGALPESKTASGFTELHYRYYEGEWTRMPDFERLEPAAEGRAPGDMITLDPRQQDDHFGFVFEGKLQARESGEHFFMIRSDDGSKLYINGEMVIDNDGLHGDGEIKIAEIHLDEGLHDVRVEFFEHTAAFNLVFDWAGPSGDELPRLTAHDRIADVRRFIVEVEDKPQVWRALLPDTSTRSIAVGLPGKISYTFDQETATVRYAWEGDFINRGGMVGHGGGRGPQEVEILGERFPIGAVQRPLRIDNAEKEPAIRFIGYRNANHRVAFLYEVDGHEVTQMIEAAPNGATGLRYHFQFAKEPTTPIHFLVNRADLQVTASAGTWNGNVLTLQPAQAREFTVTVTK